MFHWCRTNLHERDLVLRNEVDPNDDGLLEELHRIATIGIVALAHHDIKQMLEYIPQFNRNLLVDFKFVIDK